ncbi:MAG: adenine phosphoribosyltransferase [Elusimicrobiaceae bacterium]|nr:adenine phosphoribosyltransferase [Elusimicrobiaceae bacterium]
MNTIEKLAAAIRVVENFPKPGVSFKDITPILSDGALFSETMDLFADHFKNAGITKVVGMEARGFLFAPVIALKLGAGIVPVRKKGKLPHETIAETYSLEYGTDTLEMHRDALCPADKVLLVDDVLATGGTASAGRRLAKKLGAQVTAKACLIELEFLGGRKKLPGMEVFSLLKY